MGKVVWVRTRAQRAREAHMEPREQLLLDLESAGVLDPATARAGRQYFEDQANSLFKVSDKWRFVMLGRRETAELDTWLYSGNSKRPHLATRVYLHLCLSEDWRTGEAKLSRAEIAQMVSSTRSEVSSVLSDLERFGAIQRKRDGRANRIFLNSRLATALPDGQRQAAQAAAPPLGGVQLSLVE